MAFITDQEAAAAAFQTATKQAQNAVNSLFSSYGFTRQNSQGQWDTATAGSAFDPNKFIQYNPATGAVNVDTEAIRAASAGEFGTAFGYNKLTDILGTSASREALAKSALRGRGIMGGGLARQAGTAAEAQQGREVGSLAGELLGGLGGIYGDIGGAVTGAIQSNIETQGTGAQTIAGATSVSNPNVAPATSGPEAKPTSAGSRMYALSPRGGWRWMGQSKGWKKV